MNEILAAILKRFLVDEEGLCPNSTGSPYAALHDNLLVLEGEVFISNEEYDAIVHFIRENA